jgi:transcriptional regulator with XRE-family HTH domain
MIISGRQIRGARGLLGWSMEELADNCEITRLTIRQIESEAVQPQEKTLARILTVFDKEGIEFTENEGVCIRKHHMRTYSGKAGYRQLLDHIYETVQKGGRIRQFNFGDDRYISIADDYAAEHIKRMEAVEGLDAKVLVQEGDIGTPVSYCSYKTLDDEFKDMAPWYLFGDTLILPLTEGGKRECVTIHSKQVAERYIREFDTFWNRGANRQKKGRK